MRDLLTHRGPDDAGIYLDGNVGLGHRRLRIIDLAHGHQPMTNEAGTTHLVFNGEIYNYLELRALLLAKGVRLKTQGDTETILGLYDLFGDNCVQYLRGMFAFALWDSSRHRLLVARDRLGIKPLYLLRSGTTVALASEIKALLAVSDWTPRLETDSVAEYLIYRNLAGTRTLFGGVERVAAGERIVFTDGGTEQRSRYWSLPVPTSETASAGTTDRWLEELETRLTRVVREHLASDVPLGTFLSGGVDSSLVTALAAPAMREPLHTFSIGFDDPRLDERRFAMSVAENIGTHHHNRLVSDREYSDWLPEAIWHHDEPIGHPHCVHIYYLSRLAREQVTVVLTGEGADELFAGYTRYRILSLLDHLPAPSPWMRTALSAIAGHAPFQSVRRWRALFEGDSGIRVEGLAAFVDPEKARALFSRHAMPLRARESATDASTGLLARALSHDQQTYLEAVLTRLDKMSMATSLEGRVPFLDHEFVEFVAKIPANLKLRNLETKYVLKQLARRYLDSTVIDRRKVGFTVPLARWMRTGGALERYTNLLLEPQARTRGLFNDTAVRRYLDEHRSGQHDHAELLWGIVNLELWHRVVLERVADLRARSATTTRQQLA